VSILRSLFIFPMRKPMPKIVKNRDSYGLNSQAIAWP
jgi:hypothetical protein